MPKWFGSRGGGDAVPKELQSALEELLAPLEEKGRGLARRARDYVLTGSPAAVLQELARVSGYGVLVYGSIGPSRHDDAVLTVCSRLGEAPPEVGVRLGHAYAATAGSSLRLGQPDHLRWVEALLTSLHQSLATAGGLEAGVMRLDARVVEAMSVSTGRPAGEPFVAAYHATNGPAWGRSQYRQAVCSLQGYAEAVARHAEEIRPAFGQRKAEDRLLVLEMVEDLPAEVLALFAAELVEYATSTSSQVRAAAYSLVQRCGEAAVGPLREVATGGRPAARLEALVMLHRSDDPAQHAWALATASEDRAQSVRALADQWTGAAAAAEAEPLPVVEVPEVDWHTEVTPAVVSGLQGWIDDTNHVIEQANAARRRNAEDWKARYPGGNQPRLSLIEPFDRAYVEDLVKALDAGRPPELRSMKYHDREQQLGQTLPHHAIRLGLGPAGLSVVLGRVGLLRLDYSGGLHPAAAQAYDALHGTTGRPTALEIATMLDQCGIESGTAVLRALVSDGRGSLGDGWPDEDVAPFALLHLEELLALLDPSHQQAWYVEPAGVFRVLGTVPSMPRAVVDSLFAIALGSRKTVRRPAQDALAKVPGIEARVVTALSDGKGEQRALAAQWLGRLRVESTIPALEAALAQEKQDLPMGAMLDALQAMGQPVEKYLDRDALAAQAVKAVAKGLPKDLAWFPWAGLPEVRWESGESVPPETLQWFLAQAVRGKTAEPNAVLRKYAAMFDATDREAFGQFVLEAWIGQDLAPIDPEEAHRQAAAAAASMYAAIQRWPQYYEGNPLLHATEEQILATYLPTYLRQPVGSAASSKGVLAVAAACAGERAAPAVQRYLKEWYGQRAAQGRALIVMLAWIEHPSATQLMLSVGSRFRTKSFQEEATRQAELLAERKGWTVGELADRTIPSAGFDEDGLLELSYGERSFTARLLPDLTVELRSPEGKVVKALPTPRQTDDEAEAKAAKKALAATKKELKSVATLQAERFYEALCTGRGWAFDDWDRYLRRHPVMRHLTQRLAWSATIGDAVVVFRPLDDGTLTDVDDEEVTLPPDAQVLVAHDSQLTAEQVAAWQAHFVDYEVTPLFQQFGKGTHVLPEAQETALEVTDFRGHLVESFALRGRAGKLGYTRGEAQDAGWFYSYDKPFPTLGITARVEFSGNGLPETNRTVALTSLSFHKQCGGGSQAMRLSEVPAILLSEAWNDLRLMASDGPGYDPDWEKTVENW